MKTKILADFQICISVSLTGFYDDRTELNLIKISLLDLLPKNKNEEIIKINKLKQY